MTGISLKLWQNIVTRKDLLKYSGLDTYLCNGQSVGEAEGGE